MPTTGPIRGHNARIYLDDAGVYAAIDDTISINIDMIAIAHKDINPGSTGVTARQKIADIVEASGSSTAYLYTENSNHKALLEAMLAGTEMTLEKTTNVTGDMVISFPALISGAEISSSEGEITEVSFNYESSGAITVADVPV